MDSGPASGKDPFHSLTVDGVHLHGKEILTALRELPAHREDALGWTASLIDTVEHLLVNSGGLGTMSSGTTGPPKRFTIPRSDLLNSARLTASVFGLGPGDRALHCLPCDFISGKMMLVRGMVIGLDLHVIPPRGDILEQLDTDDRFAFTAMVPMQFDRMIQQDRERVNDRFRTVLLGGGPVSERLYSSVQSLRTAVVEGYGSTETVTHVALRPLNQAALELLSPGNSHPAAPGVDPGPFQAIGDVSFGRDPRGCLVVYTPHLSVQQHLTNDLITFIDERHFHWQGRADHVILSGGKKIHPEQLERRTADVLDLPHYFTSTPDDVLGQAVMLVVESEREGSELMPEVMERLTAVLHPHEWPRRIQVLPKLKRTGSGKVIRN